MLMCKKKEKKRGLNNFKFLHFYWSFSSDIVALKGLSNSLSIFQKKKKKKCIDLSHSWVSDVQFQGGAGYMFQTNNNNNKITLSD